MSDIDIINEFEDTIAKYASSKYGIAVSSCTNAIFLSLHYLKWLGVIKNGDTITIPKQTYMSVPMTLINLGFKVKFVDVKWSGMYRLHPTPVYDSATRFTKDMYVKDSLYCLSFQYRKHLPIGRGGMILTDSKQASDWLRSARFNGRTEGKSQADDEFIIRGWNMYMMPEQAARGLTLFSILPDKNKDCANWNDYPDMSTQNIFK